MERVPDPQVFVDAVEVDLPPLDGSVRRYHACYDGVRTVVDVVIACVGLLLSIPLMLLAALAVIVGSGRPVLYYQTRVGHRGRPFTLFKFRTMVKDAEVGGPRFASANDERITRVGRVLRRTRIDELPQLWNVVKLDMALIGPRPERPEFARHYAVTIPNWELRESVRPGLTGWAQVTEGYTNDLDGTVRKLERDLYYLRHRGVVLDAKVALHTVRCIVTMAGQ